MTSHPAAGFLPEALKAAREAAGMSRAQLGELIGGTRMAIHRWESGARTPQVSTVAALAEILGIEPAQLIAPPRTLAELRASRGMLQSHVAAELGVSRARYASIEAGRGRATSEQAAKLAEVFGVEPAALQEILAAG